MKCSICEKEIDEQQLGKTIWKEGHNAEPVTNGRCCTKCNNEVVIPARIKNIRGKRQ